MCARVSAFIQSLCDVRVTSLASSFPAPNVGLGLEKAFSLGPGRSPIPPKLVAKIFSYKFVDLTELLPENLDDPLSDTTSFTIENSTIVPVSRSSARERKSDLDILPWVECFNSYISFIATHRPHRARDLLAYLALIIRTTKRFGGKAWFHYDRAFRREAEVNNVQDGGAMHTDLYNFHMSAATRAPDAQFYTHHRATKPLSRDEATGNPGNPQLCLPLRGRPVDFAMHATSGRKNEFASNLPCANMLQICCKYEICKALQPVQRWQWPNLHKNGQIRPLPPLHWLQSFANFIFATYLHQANLGQIRFGGCG